jgi:hypothetical protein
VDEELRKAAEAAGLQKLLECDGDALARAFTAAEGYAARRAPVRTPALEPAHCFRPESLAPTSGDGSND